MVRGVPITSEVRTQLHHAFVNLRWTAVQSFEAYFQGNNNKITLLYLVRLRQWFLSSAPEDHQAYINSVGKHTCGVKRKMTDDYLPILETLGFQQPMIDQSYNYGAAAVN